MTEWVPESCTLPTDERPLRVAEFDELFTTSARRAERVAATHARILLAGAVGLEDLTARETECCSFFTFTITPATADGEQWLDVEVPVEQVAVLDALIERVPG